MSRSHTNDLFEVACQMALTTKPNLSRYLCEWFACLDQPLGVTNAYAFQIGIRRHPNFGTKYAQQMVRTERDVFGQLGQADALGKMFIDIVACPLDCFSLPAQSLFVRVDVGVALDELRQGPGKARLTFERTLFLGQGFVQA